MTSREVRDQESNVTWNCVQAFTGTNGAAAEKAAELAKEGNMVAVVCTPTGGAQTVRLKLHEGWLDSLNDQQLIDAIRREALSGLNTHPG